MPDAAYATRRAQVRTYFDRTAVDAWKRFATDAPLGRIRETVRQGRAMMRRAILDALPEDVAGWRILDAGCGAGAIATELSRRGADVTAIDLSGEIVAFAQAGAPASERPIRWLVGDALDPSLGRFDAVVSMDCLIHYSLDQTAEAVAGLSERTRHQILFTFAPRTPLLGAMHAAGRLFPRGDRSPAIEPVSEARLAAALKVGLDPLWQVVPGPRISRGFYTSKLMEVVRP
jgi:magnesium-protoporphyrin O-methyltransferase